MSDMGDTSDNNTPYLREARACALRYRLGLLTEQDLADAFGLALGEIVVKPEPTEAEAVAS